MTAPRSSSHLCRSYGCKVLVPNDGDFCRRHHRVRLHDDGELEITIELPRPDFVIERVHVWETEHAGDAYYYPDDGGVLPIAAITRLYRGFRRIDKAIFGRITIENQGACPVYVDQKWPDFVDNPLGYCMSRRPVEFGVALLAEAWRLGDPAVTARAKRERAPRRT